MENKKLTKEEMSQIETIKQKSQAIVQELGQLELLRLDLRSRKDNALAFLEELRQEEKDLAQALEAAYGKGTIDLEKGEFTPFVEEAEEVK
jgi:K+/H+ antiporter YhaU regulatory subunit KhtT